MPLRSKPVPDARSAIFPAVSRLSAAPLPRRPVGIILSILFLAVLLAGDSAARETLEPQPGMLLVADRRIQDPRFQESVILLLNAGRGGAAGVILNKPTATRISRLFEVTKGTPHGADPIYYGGPVGGHELLMLNRSNKAPAGWTAFLAGVALTNSPIVMQEALLSARSNDDVRIFAGYAGWARGQLEGEMRRGEWYLVPADAAKIFRRDMKKLWPELYRKSREIIL